MTHPIFGGRRYKTHAYEKRHYEHAASVAREHPEETNLIERFVEMFKGDNPRFDENRFRTAATKK